MSVVDIRVVDEINVEIVYVFLNLNFILVDMDNMLRIVDFFVFGDEINDEIVFVLLDFNCILIDVEEILRFVDFFVLGDEIDGDVSGWESFDFEMLFVSYYMERMDFEEKEDVDDELVVKW